MKKFLIIFFISMVPLIELRGAIPVAVGMGLPVIPSIVVSILGNMVPVPFIFLFARRFLEWGRDRRYIGGICRWCLEKGERLLLRFRAVAPSRPEAAVSGGSHYS